MKKILSLLMCMCAGTLLYAQTQKVTGCVLDAVTGEPLIGVSVLETGTTNGTITDLDGNFALKVNENAALQFSYMGYQSLELKSKKRRNGSDPPGTRLVHPRGCDDHEPARTNPADTRCRQPGHGTRYRGEARWTGVPGSTQEHTGCTRQRKRRRMG